MAPKPTKASPSKRLSTRPALLSKSAYSSKYLIVFILCFSLVGGWFIYKSFAATIFYISPSGNDSNPCSQAAPCLSFNRAYQVASPGSKVQIASGTYSSQTISPKSSMRNLSPGCTLQDTTNCVTFEPVGSITINGKLEVRGSSVYIKGTRSTSTPDANATFTIKANGYADIEADSDSTYPDHVILQGIDTNSFGAFNVNTATFKDMDVGPATVYWGNSSEICCREGTGMENKIGWGGDVSYVPRDITFDSIRIHDQNGDSTRLQPGADVHFGGLFLVTVDGLTVKNSVFERNVVYHVQIQNFGGAPPAKRVVFDNNSFGCPVDWEYLGDVCDGQNSIQFDYDPGTEFTISNNVEANGAGKIYACYVGSCGGLTGVNAYGNTGLAASTTAPPLPGGSNPPPPPPQSNPSVTITASPSTITSGSSSTIVWSSANVSSCTASGAWSGAKATSGSQSVAPTTTSTYNLSCTGANGSAADSATVTIVSGSGPPTFTSFSPTSGPIGTQVTINGTNLDKATIVEFYRGGVVNFTINSPTKIIATVSPGSQTGYMSINQGEALSPQPFTVTATSTKTGDLNGDNQVNISDLSILLSNYSTTNTTADINKDGTVNILDLSILLTNYGT